MLTWRTGARRRAAAGRRSAGALSALSDMLTREFGWRSAEAGCATSRRCGCRRRGAAARRAAVRGRAAAPRRRQRQRAAPRRRRACAYVITVVRRGCTGEVQHRFSDWLALHRRLGELGVGPLPSAPARLPFRGYAVATAVRSTAAGGGPAAEPSPRGRALLLRFSAARTCAGSAARRARRAAAARARRLPAPRRALTCATPARPAAPPARRSAAARAARRAAMAAGGAAGHVPLAYSFFLRREAQALAVFVFRSLPRR